MSEMRLPTRNKKLGGDHKKYIGVLIALVVICVICVIGSTPLSKKITQGLDIRGGVSVVMTAHKAQGQSISKQEMELATSIVTNRVNSLGASEATVQQQGDTSILVQIPGATDPEEALKIIGRQGLLEFVNLYDITDQQVLQELRSGKENVKLPEGSYKAFMKGDAIENATIGQEQNQAYYSVNLRLNKEGTEEFAKVTRELAPVHGGIAIVLDGVVNSVPAVQNAITDGRVAITGHYTLNQAKNLKTVLDSGSLPVSLDYAESRVIGPTLGQDSLHQGLLAIAIGMIAVAIYLFFFYQGMGLLTAGSLLVFAIVYLGILALLSKFGAFALSLPGIAGIVLTIGMAADSSILVLERFREEIRMGKSVRSASISGVAHGIGTSLDADIVSLVSAFVLFFVAIGPVKGFGLTLALGILCDIFTMFWFKAPLLRLLAPKEIKRHPGFWGVKSDIKEAQQALKEA